MSKIQYQVFFEAQQHRLPLFVYPWYLDAVCTEGIWDAVVVEEKGNLVAAMPYFVKKRYGFRYITMPPFVKFMGPFFANPVPTLNTQHDLLEKLIAQLPKVQAFTQNFYYPITNWLPFYWNGFQQTTRYSYRIEIENLEQAYQAIDAKRRKYIEKTSAQGIKVMPSDDVRLFYQINAKSFERQGLRIPYSWEQFRQHDQALSAHQARQILFAKDEQGRIHAGAYLIWDAHSAYYHFSGDDPDLRSSRAGFLLIWEAIRYTKEVLALKTFDFEGSIIQNVEYIRRQFGGVQTPYFTVWKYSGPLLSYLANLRRP